MKSLQESLFDDDLVQKDPFDEIIDHLDTKRYSLEIALKSLKRLFEWFESGGKYNLRNAAKINDLLKAIQKNNWVMVAKKSKFKVQPNDYELIWPYYKNNGYLDKYLIGWGDRWIYDEIDIGWDISSETGAREVVNRLKNIGFDECVLITDKKMKDALQKRIKELCVR